MAAVLALCAGVAGAAEPDAGSAPWMTLSMPLEFSRTTSGFATRRHPIRKTLHLHAGVDFAAPHGTPVRSVADGSVVFSGTQKGYGKVVYVQHGGLLTTVYAHLSRIDVRVGQRIRQGVVIGAVGNSGLATGPHLHFEVRENGKPIDPLRLAYAAPAGTKVEVPPAVDHARCLALLQKASLDTLDPHELETLRTGCLE